VSYISWLECAAAFDVTRMTQSQRVAHDGGTRLMYGSVADREDRKYGDRAGLSI
jgi:hypothetical protein